MENIEKYIGIVHEYQGNGTTCDCLNLVSMFYKDHGWKPDWDDHMPRPATYEEYIKKQPTRMIRYLLKNFDKTLDLNDLVYGDVVLILVCGEPHIGVMLHDEKVLSMEIPVVYGKSKSTIYKGRYWKPFFRCGFKRRI